MRGRSVRLGLAILVAGAPLARAQDFGITGGVAISKFAGDDVGEFSKTRLGLVGGVFAYFRLSDVLGIQPEVLYFQKGGKGETAGFTAEVRLSYLEVPLLLKLAFPEGGRLRPHLYAGGAMAFKLGCRLRVSSATADDSSPCEDDPETQVTDTDFSVILGAGVEFDRATLSLRYDWGLTKLDAGPEENHLVNRTVYLLLSWTFRPPR